jgi:hypothetical protein
VFRNWTLRYVIADERQLCAQKYVYNYSKYFNYFLGYSVNNIGYAVTARHLENAVLTTASVKFLRMCIIVPIFHEEHSIEKQRAHAAESVVTEHLLAQTQSYIPACSQVAHCKLLE